MTKYKVPRLYKGKKPNIKYWKRVKNRHPRYLEHDGIKQNTPDWFKQRKGKCSGSVWSVAIALFEKKAGNRVKNTSKSRQKSLDLFKKLNAEYNEKEYENIMSEEEKDKMAVYCDWGSYHESTAIYNFLENYAIDGKVRECGFMNGKTKYTGSSPDGVFIVGDKETPIEVKCRTPLYFNKKTQEWNYMNRCKPFDKIPFKYIPQTYAHMHVTDSDSCVFISWSPMNGCNIFNIKKDNRLMELILYYIDRFYNDFVVKGKEPPENYFFEEEKYQEMLKKLAEVRDNTPIVKTTENLENALMYDSWLFE